MEVLQGEIPVSNNDIELSLEIKLGKRGIILEKESKQSFCNREGTKLIQESGFLQNERHSLLSTDFSKASSPISNRRKGNN